MRRGLIALLIVLWAVPAWAANHYIRAAASGTATGASWANAWTTFAQVTWTRGDTYYVAGGTYTGSISITRAISGSLWITIKKANAADNAGDVGWDASYATTEALILGTLDFTSYVAVDGVTGSGESGHGIRVYSTGSGHVVQPDGLGPFHIYHVNIQGPGYVGSSNIAAVYWNGTAGKGLHIKASWMHNVPWNGVCFGDLIGTSWTDYGMLFEDNVVSETGGTTTDDHAQGMQIGYNSTTTYLIIRNNLIRNTQGSANIAYLGGAASHTYSRIYNNVFYITDTGTYNVLSPGAIWTHDQAFVDYFYIYNNSFYNISASGAYGRILLEHTNTPTVAEARNNLWVSSYLPAGGCCAGTTVSSHNGFYDNTGTGDPGDTESAMPMVAPAAGNFQLTAASNAKSSGVDLSSVFTADLRGYARSVPWSVGAYEYGASSGVYPSAPTNVRVRAPAVEATGFVIDHTSVELYSTIPDAYLAIVRQKWFNMAGESHSRAYRKGLVALQAATGGASSKYAVIEDVNPGTGNVGTGDALAIDYYDVSGSVWHGSSWYNGAGEETWFYGGANKPQGHITKVSTTSYRPSMLGFGWCWDAYLTPSDFDTYNTATQGYSTYARSLGSRVSVVFTTGPVDGSGSANRDAKYQRVRAYVAAHPDEVLFDYADILEHNNAGQKYASTYEEIHPDNADSGSNSHVGAAGELRLAKAAWVLMARLAGWTE